MTDSPDDTTIHPINTDCPPPPRRMVADRVLLKKREDEMDPAWESRRASKMRERFPVGGNHQPLPGLNLVAPVQPSICNPCPLNDNQL